MIIKKSSKKVLNVIISPEYKKHNQYTVGKKTVNGCIQHNNKTLKVLATHCERPNRPPLHICISPSVIMKIADVRGGRFTYTSLHSDNDRNMRTYSALGLLNKCFTFIQKPSTFIKQLCYLLQTNSTRNTKEKDKIKIPHLFKISIEKWR